MELKISRDNQIADYNFLVSGGAIGTYRTGLFIDEFSLMDVFWIEQKVALASAGLATISVGFITAAGASFPAAIIAASPFGGPYVPFLTSNPSGLVNSVAIEITFSIGVAPLTAGQMLFVAGYFNKDI